MTTIPVMGFAAYSGTGKTTLVEKILVSLKRQGYRVAVLKHDAHSFEIDREGKDSWRFAQAGADMVILSSSEKTAVIEQRQRSFSQNLTMVHDVDLILVEGYKQEDIPRIGICRKATGKGLPHPVDAYVALVTDDPSLCPGNLPVFSLEDVEGIVDFIKKYADL